MASEVIHCPSCRHPVRVPESLFGQPVRCPECKSYFAAPTRDAAGKLGEPELLPDTQPTRMAGPRPSTTSQSPLFVPALFLMLMGVVGSIANGYTALQFQIKPQAARATVIDALKQFAEKTNRPFNEDDAKKAADIAPMVYMAIFIINLIPIAGAIAMLRMRMWWLAVTGSITAMLSIGSCCCLIGLPIGIWSLVKLFDPEIRAMFSRTA